MSVERLPDAWPCISLREPWLFAVLYLDKRIENRKWWAGHRGPIWLHRATYTSLPYEEETFAWMHRRGLIPNDRIGDHMGTAMQYRAYVRPGKKVLSGLVGYAELDGVLPPTDGVLVDFHQAKREIASFRSNVPDADAMLRWKFEEQYGFVLRNVQKIPRIEVAGRQRWFYLPADVERRARASIGKAA